MGILGRPSVIFHKMLLDGRFRAAQPEPADSCGNINEIKVGNASVNSVGGRLEVKEGDKKDERKDIEDDGPSE